MYTEAQVHGALDRFREKAENDLAITTWIDTADFEGYGYTEELKEEIAALKEEMRGMFKAPECKYLDQRMKLDFFLNHFNKFTLADLEGLLEGKDGKQHS